jgi:hypothetical protein
VGKKEDAFVWAPQVELHDHGGNDGFPRPDSRHEQQVQHSLFPQAEAAPYGFSLVWSQLHVHRLRRQHERALSQL